ncbi:MAG: imidazole glycerol phosphate synthase subunit HisF [Armatimonadetes bacterium]|nr:MAG: imidazole glycerol phosphate synthase subunit HisF [Armatimonadota bacterium]
MLAPRVIPCLDVDGGRVVKGVQFSDLRDAGDPVEIAASYEQQGADEIVILDVSATPEGRGNAVATVAAVRAVLSIPLTVGGGVRSMADAGRLLDAGADRVAANTAAVERPELIEEIAAQFGTQCAVISIDAGRRNGGWEVLTTSGTSRTGMDVGEWATRCAGLGAGEILLTSWDRDGTRKGYDTELLSSVSDLVTIPIIASGGAGQAIDLVAAIHAGASAVLVASLLHDRDLTVADLKATMTQHGIEVRT